MLCLLTLFFSSENPAAAVEAAEGAEQPSILRLPKNKLWFGYKVNASETAAGGDGKVPHLLVVIYISVRGID